MKKFLVGTALLAQLMWAGHGQSVWADDDGWEDGDDVIVDICPTPHHPTSFA